MVRAAKRSQIVDAALVGLVVIASAWLARLVYHNYLGGHVVLELADWTIPVPEGTRVIEYDDPPLEDRDARIELVEDLVIGPRGEDSNYLFFQPQEVAVDRGGRMYVVEMGNKRVQVFDADGTYARTLGREGQGPGELEMPVGIAVAGDRVVVSDWGNRRLSMWDLEGTHVGDLSVANRWEAEVFGTDAGSIVAGTSRDLEDRSKLIDVGLYSVEGARSFLYISLPEPKDFLMMGDRGGMVMPRLSGGPSFVATAAGVVYATTGHEYQIRSFDPDGSVRWALRAARPRVAFGDEHKSAVLDPVREQFDDLTAMQLEWPESLHTISRLFVDGHGHLYVFPYFFRGMSPDERPIEVYSADGERLFAGLTNQRGWRTARGDFVYAMRRNEQTEESELVRYRLVEPF